jgi:hypothetical protein
LFVRLKTAPGFRFCANLTSALRSGNEPGSQAAWRLRFNRTKKSADPTSCKTDPCLQPCKVLGGNRTKMFHVKHF